MAGVCVLKKERGESFAWKAFGRPAYVILPSSKYIYSRSTRMKEAAIHC